MASSKTPLKAFWDALNKGDEDEAMRAFRFAALPGPDGAPSPRVAALMETGDWDSTMKVSLVLLKEGACAGAVNNDENRVCGRYNCPTAAHERGAKKVRPGWYISAGSSANGYFRTPWLARESEGGPIKSRAAAMLTDGKNPFRLNREQWKFVIESGSPVNQGVSEYKDDEYPPSQESENAQSWEQVSPAAAETGPTFKPLVVDTTVPDSPATLDSGIDIGDMKAKLVHVLETVDELASRVMTLEVQLEEATAEASYYKGQVRDLLPRTFNLERLVQQNGLGSGTLGPGMGQRDSAALMPMVERLKADMYGDQGQIAHLKVQISQIKERQDSGTGVAIGNFRFTSKNELLSWYAARNPEVGIFMDAHAMMHAVAPTHATISDTMKIFEAQQRVKHTNELETAVRTSFKTIVPSVFIGSNTVTDNSTFSALKSAIKDYNAWKPPQTKGTGVSKRIEDGVMTVDRRINELRYQLTNDPDVIELSSALTRDSLLFVNRLCHFMEEQHIQYSDTSYTASQIWEMQLECLQTILEELDAARRPYADAANFEPGLFLWAMLQAWKIQQRYMSNSFHDDPALTGVFVRRILMSRHFDRQ